MNNREIELEKLVVEQALALQSLRENRKMLHECILGWEDRLPACQFEKLQTEMRAVAATLV